MVGRNTDDGKREQVRFWRRVAVLFAGTGSSQIILVAASPLLTRVYGPSRFGEFAIYTGLLAILLPMATGRLELKLPTAEKGDLKIIVSAVGILSIIVGAVSSLLFYCMNGWGLVQHDSVSWLSVLLFVGLLAASGEAAGSYLAIRLGRFRVLATNGVLRSSSIVLSQVASGFSGLVGTGLVAGDVFGRSVGALRLLVQLFGRQLTARLRFARVVKCLSDNWRFSIIAAPGGAINAAGLQAPLMLIGAIYGPAAAGQFALAQRVVGLPVRLVGQAVGQAFIGWIADERGQGVGLGKKYDWAILRLLAGGTPLILAIALTASLWIEPIFGAGWSQVVAVLQVTCFVTILQFGVGALTQTLGVLGFPGRQAGWEGFRAALSAGALLLGGWMGLGFLDAVKLYALGSVFSYLALYVMTRASISDVNLAHKEAS